MRDVSKLPVWAQVRIKTLENDIQWYKDQLAAVNGDESPIFWTMHTDPHHIPDSATVTFRLKNGREIDIDIGDAGTYLIVRCDSIIIMPGLSNTIYIK